MYLEIFLNMYNITTNVWCPVIRSRKHVRLYTLVTTTCNISNNNN